QSEQPCARGPGLVEAKKVCPDELEQVDLLRVQGIDAGAFEPTRDARATHSQQVRDGGSGLEVSPKGLHLGGGGHRHPTNLAQRILLAQGLRVYVLRRGFMRRRSSRPPRGELPSLDRPPRLDAVSEAPWYLPIGDE